MSITKRQARERRDMAQIEAQKRIPTHVEMAAPSFWQRMSVQQTLYNGLMYALLLGIGIVVLLPLSWMLTAALRGDGEIVFTIPVSWFPTTSFHFENFWRVLTYQSYPLWRPTWNTLMLVALNIVGTLISNSLVAYAFAR